MSSCRAASFRDGGAVLRKEVATFQAYEPRHATAVCRIVAVGCLLRCRTAGRFFDIRRQCLIGVINLIDKRLLFGPNSRQVRRIIIQASGIRAAIQSRLAPAG